MLHTRGFLLSVLTEFNRNRLFMGHNSRLPASSFLLLTLAGCSVAATPDRITRPLDDTRTHTVAGNVNHLAQPQYDQGAGRPADADGLHGVPGQAVGLPAGGSEAVTIRSGKSNLPAADSRSKAA
jgi:hypothetical protein